MKKNRRRFVRSCALSRLCVSACASLALTACNLDLEDPNFPPEDVVFNDPTGLLALGIGLQAEFADAIVNPVYVVGLITDEIGAGSATFLNFQNADIGAALDPATDMSVAPWTSAYRVIKLSNDLLRSVPEAQLLPGTKSGLLALAKLHKAMTLGWLVQLYEQAPLDAGIDNPQPSFDNRQAILAEVVRLLGEARNDLTTTTPSTEFNSVLAPGFNLLNTIDAMLARFNLIAGNSAAAMAAALRVTATSELRYSATDRNSINNLMYRSGNAFQMRPEQTFRTQAEAGDRRVQYWVTAASVAGANNKQLDELNKYRADDSPFPLFLPDEMKLIQAEASVRLNQLAAARMFVNQVRTQCFTGTGDPPEPMPCLPALSDTQLATSAAILDEILRQRRYELYLQGVLYEDLRRFGRTLKYPWVPYPTTECDRNENAPC